METRSRSPGRPKRPGRRRKSPVVVISSSTRKSPSRKSPSRKSPSRKSPSRKSSPPKISPGKLKIIEKSTWKDSIENKITSKDEKLRSSPTRHLKIRLDKLSTIKTTTTTTSSSKIIKSSTDTIDIGSSISPPSRPTSAISYNQSKLDDISGDSEIVKITSFPISSSLTRRSVSITKLTPSTHHLTPTPSVTATSTDRHSRSVSRSVYDASKTEYSDDDDDDDNNVNIPGSQSSYSNYRYGDGINTGGLFKNSYTKLTNVSRNINVPKEYGGIIGCIFLLIFIPTFTYYLQWTCEKSNLCNFKKITIPTNLPKSISDIILPDLKIIDNIFTKDTVNAYIIYMITLFISSSIIRIGYEIKLPPSDRGIIRYNFNALSISILITITFVIGEILQYDISNFIYKNYLKLMIFNILSSLLLSIWFLIRSNFIQKNQWNHYGKSGNILIDYCQGREINPKWLNLIDYKLIFNRISLITTLLLIEILIYKNLQLPKIQSTTTTPTTTASSTMENDQTITNITSSTINIIDTIQYYYKNTKITNTSSIFSAILVLIYITDSIIFEHHLATSFELQQEGCGSFLMLRYAITPFLLVSIPKYLYDIKPNNNLSWWIIIFSIILLIIGLLIKRKSNSIKYRYRLDPYHKDTAYMDTLPTFQGKRLLLGKLWGTVRQPNYIGDIIALISLLLPLFNKFVWPPFISIILIIIYLIHRAYRINLRNFSRYNSAWQRYCTKVRYILIPKVY